MTDVRQSGAPTLSQESQKRWAIGGCVGCLGFLILAVGLSILSVKRALAPGNVWGQLSAYMGVEPEAPPEGYRALFVLPFFDQRQIAFYRESDNAQVLLQEYSGRVREDFDLAFDVEHLEALDGVGLVEAGTLTLQGREVDVVRFVAPRCSSPSPGARAACAAGSSRPSTCVPRTCPSSAGTRPWCASASRGAATRAARP